MAFSSEIEKLERICAENPQGRTFAPLAEAYRKHGDLDRAFTVLRAGLELHPDYIPASIVLGRCHFDRNELADAERAFAHVLTLDPENVIALKALADLSEREGRLVQAERWLNLLLAVDPSNSSALEQVERIRRGPEQVPEQVPEPADAERVAAMGAPAGGSDTEPDSGSEPEPAADEEPVELAVSEDAAGDAPVLDITVEREEEIVLTPSSDSDYRRDDDSGLPRVRSDAGADDDPFGYSRFDADTGESAPWTAAADEARDDAEPQEPAADRPAMADWATSETSDEEDRRDTEAEPEPEPAFEAEGETAFAPDAEEPAFEPVSEVEPAGVELAPDVQPDLGAEPDEAPEPVRSAAPGLPSADPTPDPVLTESMAELYLRQGHHAEALEIYHELAARRPDDRRLADVVANLEATLAAPARRETAPSPSEDAAAEPAAARVPYAAAETGGRSVGELLRFVLAERLPPAETEPERFSPAAQESTPLDAADMNAADDQGEPTRPAQDHLTLGAVFGEDEAAAPPAVPAPEREEAGGLSFDEFFGGAPGEQPDATRTAAQAPRAAQGDDLDQFHAWLQSLKR